jgi:hypothetical protein
MLYAAIITPLTEVFASNSSNLFLSKLKSKPVLAYSALDPQLSTLVKIVIFLNLADFSKSIILFKKSFHVFSGTERFVLILSSKSSRGFCIT